MLDFAFVMTIFFLLLGPVKIIPAFARETREGDPSFRRAAALWATLFAALICTVVALGTHQFAGKYHLSLPAIQLTGGLILLLWALNSIFPRREPAAAPREGRTARHVALSPLATPVIVTPAGIAAIMVFTLLASHQPGGYETIALALAVVMALDLLVMYANDRIVRLPGLLTALQLLGAVLVVVQVALALQVLLDVFTKLGLLHR